MAGLSVVFRRTLVASTLTAPVNSSPVPCPNLEFVDHTSPLCTDTTLPMTSPLLPSTPSRPKGPQPRLTHHSCPQVPLSEFSPMVVTHVPRSPSPAVARSKSLVFSFAIACSRLLKSSLVSITATYTASLRSPTACSQIPKSTLAIAAIVTITTSTSGHTY